MVLDFIPDPANLWRSQKHYTVSGRIDDPLSQQFQLKRMHPEMPMYPILTKQGDVPVHLVGTPTPASVYEPVPARKPNNDPASNQVVHFAEGPTFTAQGEVRDHVLHPFHHLGYTLTHHPVEFVEQLFHYTKQGLGWVVWNYQDLYEQLKQWDGSWIGFSRSMGLAWRAVVVGLITLGLFELGPLLEALALWLRLVFDFVRGALGLVGEAVDALWYVLQRVWDDVTSLWQS